MRHRSVVPVVASAALALTAGWAVIPNGGVAAQEADGEAPSIELGDRNELAAWWQDRLNTWIQLADTDLDTLTVDGWYGPNTEAATTTFQQATGDVPADGIVDPEDRVALADAIDALERPTDDGSDGSGDVSPDEDEAVGELSTQDRTSTTDADEVATLVDVITSTLPDFTRITFSFEQTGDDVVGYEIGYVDDVPVAASGEAPEVDGGAYLEVVIRNAARYRVDTGEPVYEGPDRITLDGSDTAAEVVLVEDFEGVMTWVIGVSSEVGFAAATTSDGVLVVDVSAG